MFNEDLSVFFDDSSGGFASAFTVNDVPSDNYKAIFDTQYAELDGMGGDRPVMVFEAAHYIPVAGDTIVNLDSGETFTVAYAEPANQGVRRVLLERT